MLENLYNYFLGLFSLTGDKAFSLWFPSFHNGGWVSSSIPWAEFAPTLSIIVSLIIFFGILITLFKIFRFVFGCFFIKG